MTVNTQTANRLAAEKSPYLLQHCNNPVNWFPWGEEAFAEAHRLDRPVFLSIGYSACHWCHVMAEESFSNEHVAQVMNDNFIAIKVDREERPDLDNLFIKAVTAITGSAGWPLNVFLTPNKLPFYGGSYFPTEDADGKVGLLTVLDSVSAAWKDNRDEIQTLARKISTLITLEPMAVPETEMIGPSVMRRGYEFLRNNFDHVNGGFGTQPKFPTAFYITFLLRYDTCFTEPHAREIALKTLVAMWRGGIHDQIAGGFHRYSTDERWFLPHFEKMLYDQALLAGAYLEAYPAAGDARLAVAGRATVDFVLERMGGPEGAFFSSLDADSFPYPGAQRREEGAFYLWSANEIDALLEIDAPLVRFHFGITPEGNINFDPAGTFRGKNILYTAHSMDETAEEFGVTRMTALRALARSCSRLRAARDTREPPDIDEKILCDWNSLMISTLCSAHTIFPRAGYASAAARAADFILNAMRDGQGGLMHRYCGGELSVPGMLDDYAFFTAALLDLHETTLLPEYLIEAVRIASCMVERFRDVSHKGYFLSAAAHTEPGYAQKELFDGAVPAGSSLALSDMVRLYALTGDKCWKDRASELAGFASEDVARAPYSYINFLAEMFSLVGREECGCGKP